MQLVDFRYFMLLPPSPSCSSSLNPLFMLPYFEVLERRNLLFLASDKIVITLTNLVFERLFPKNSRCFFPLIQFLESIFDMARFLRFSLSLLLDSELDTRVLLFFVVHLQDSRHWTQNKKKKSGPMRLTVFLSNFDRMSKLLNSWLN